MNAVSKNDLLKYLSIAIIIAIIGKAFGLIAIYMLPHEGVSLQKSYSMDVGYHRYKVGNIIAKSKKAPPEKKEQKIEFDATDVGIEIVDMQLKGLYGNSKSGFAVVAMKSNPKKTTLVGIGESYNSYRLLDIKLDHAIFSKGGTKYSLFIKRSSKMQNMVSNSKKKPQQPQEEVGLEEGSSYDVSKEDIHYYAKNFKQIWRDIGIAPVKKMGRLVGFRVTRIKKGSPMAKLGLQKGDTIIKVNNKIIRNYKEVVDIYNNLDKLDAISIVVARSNIEKEIVYELK